MTEYVIATDSRRCDEVLFMVDRSRQRASFWSNRLDDAMKYEHKAAAAQRATGLRFNNARVLTMKEAALIADEQARERKTATIDDDAGWDGHKEYF